MVKYKVKLSGPGLTVDREIPQALAERIALLLFGGKPEASKGEGNGRAKKGAQRADVDDGTEEEAGDGAEDTAPVAIGEYLKAHEAARNIEQIAAIGNYMKLHQGKSHFTRPDLEAGFENAGESVPKNLTRDMNWTIKTGWIAAKPGSDGSYYVTNSGMAAVEAKFPKELRAKTKVSRGGRKKKSKKEASK